MELVVQSFAYSKGIPAGSSMVINAKFLRPPMAIDSLQKLTGLDPKVGAFLEGDPDLKEFFIDLLKMLMIFLNRYQVRYSDVPIISIGCTGGQHRSVYMTEKLSKKLQELGYSVTTWHTNQENWII